MRVSSTLRTCGLSIKPAMMLKWQDEKQARPISRTDAAATIRLNRRADRALRILVQRKHAETYISSTFLGVACCIFRAQPGPSSSARTTTDPNGQVS